MGNSTLHNKDTENCCVSGLQRECSGEVKFISTVEGKIGLLSISLCSKTEVLRVSSKWSLLRSSALKALELFMVVRRGGDETHTTENRNFIEIMNILLHTSEFSFSFGVTKVDKCVSRFSRLSCIASGTITRMAPVKKGNRVERKEEKRGSRIMKHV